MNALLSQLTGLSQPTVLSPTGAEPALPKSPESPYFWMPLDASVTTRDVDWLYDVMVWISVISAVGIFATMVYFVLKYRAKSRTANERVEETSDHNTTLEITWSFIPLVVVIALFVWGFKGYVDLRTSPKDALEIHVTAQKWSWLFHYPAELTGSAFSHNELHVPKDTPVRIIISSTDVLHSLFIPAFRVKMDAVPGRYTELWFNATRTGDFPIFCTEYCGTSHSDMLSRTVVHPPDEFKTWVGSIEDKRKDEDPVKLGESLYNERGCATCHSLDGSVKVGPTWKGVFGSTETMTDGSTVTVDENYIKESIEEPQKRVVQGFPPSMPTYQGQLKDYEIRALVEFIKAQK